MLRDKASAPSMSEIWFRQLRYRPPPRIPRLEQAQLLSIAELPDHFVSLALVDRPRHRVTTRRPVCL